MLCRARLEDTFHSHKYRYLCLYLKFTDFPFLFQVVKFLQILLYNCITVSLFNLNVKLVFIHRKYVTLPVKIQLKFSYVFYISYHV